MISGKMRLTHLESVTPSRLTDLEDRSLVRQRITGSCRRCLKAQSIMYVFFLARDKLYFLIFVFVRIANHNRRQLGGTHQSLFSSFFFIFYYSYFVGEPDVTKNAWSDKKCRIGMAQLPYGQYT
ncbi:hypothetical protein BCR43DRAFT_196788 [Syncephalastrum racemosum]|uniref:Uncharacterized protein n=1 Tax=Syncephalastrum racemosum TaxID=13706 RepID=A0A1X2HHJ0_SYNRA|nr:hypothetical protein BCR43DRAFT_196788 [Syncephalastrum racemosum]